MRSRRHPGGTRTILIAHPGADLYGSDRVLLETVVAMGDRGWRVFVSLPAVGPLMPELTSRGATVTVNPTAVLRKSALGPFGLLRVVWETIQAVPRGVSLIRATGADVVFVNTLTIPLWLILARVMRVPSVCHVHEAEASAPLWQQRALALPLLLANRLIANSKFSRDVLGRAFVRLAVKTTVVYNGVAGPDHPVAARETLVGPARLLFVGRLSPRKGPRVAIDAVRSLTQQGMDVRLDLVGDVFPGYEWFADELRDVVQQENLTDRVTFHGFQADIWPHVAAADVMLVPSQLDEPFGNTAVEAILAARPVVVSATSGLREAADGVAAARSVEPGDPEALALAVQDVLAKWPKYAGLAAADALTARERYAPERYQKEVADCVDNLIGQTS